MIRLVDDGEVFYYAAHPHDDDQGGFSYSIQMSPAPGDTIHVDTKPGAVFTDVEICALRAYFALCRERITAVTPPPSD